VPKRLIMAVEGPGREEYQAVDERTGVDAEAEATTWPLGLLFHAAGRHRDQLVRVRDLGSA
jgi:hypothetical protein